MSGKPLYVIDQSFDLSDQLSKHFKWAEFLWLNTVGLYCYPTKPQTENLKKFILKVEKVRELLDEPMYPTSGIRPPLYNKLIGGADQSAHMLGIALDFRCRTRADAIRAVLIPKLEEYDLRMENKPGSGWIHIDGAPVTVSRFFVP